MHRTALLRIILVAALPVAACRCDDGEQPTRKAEARRQPTGEELEVKLPQPEGVVFDPQVLAGVLPPTLGEATPEGDIRTENAVLSNGGATSSASRTYVHGDHTIIVQITDMLHAPLLRAMMANAKERLSKGGSSSWKLATVQGRDAIAQHLADQRQAIANVIATDRLFVNVRVEPADSSDVAVAWAAKIPIEPITKLQPPSQPMAPSPAQPPPM